MASALSNRQNCTCARKTLQTQRGRTHGAGCVRQWFRTAEPLGERRYENWNTHITSFVKQLLMGRCQCQQCLREFARSDSLKRHMFSGVCKAMSDSEESAISEASDVKAGRKYLKGMKGHDIFGEYDYSKHSEDQDAEASEIETDNDSAGEENKDKTKCKKSQKTNSWDRVMRITYRDNQDQFDETMENTLQETPNTDVESAEEMAYEELKPKYRSSLVSKYQDLVALGSALRKDPVHKKVMSAAHRLRDEKDYDEEEAM